MLSKRFQIFLSALIVVFSLIFVSCKEISKEQHDNPSKSSTGSIIAHLVWNSDQEQLVFARNSESPGYATLPAAVSTIRGIVSGADMVSIQKDFPVAAGEGKIDNIPSGINRTLTVQGLDSGETTLYQGETTLITITAGTTTDGGIIEMTSVDDSSSPGFTVSSISGNTTEAAGGIAAFTVKLKSQPTADVTIGVSSSDITEGTVNSPSLTFTSSNWSNAQTIEVTGVDDFLVDGNQIYSIILAAVSSNDSNYDGLNPDDVSVTNEDDEIISPPTISNPSPTDASTVAEGGSGQLLSVSVSNATSCILYYDDDSFLNSSQTGSISGGSCQTTVPYVLGKMTNNGTNYWYVEATNNNGTTRYPISGNLWFTVNPSLTPPDLTVTSFTPPSFATQNQNFNISATIKNNGGESASSFRIGIYRSSNTTISTSDTLLDYCSVTSLSGGSSTTCSQSVSISTTGSQYVGVIADYQNTASESNEGNNTDYKSITITEGNTGTFTDSRNNKTYNWVEIGAYTWMAENLDYSSSGSTEVSPFGVYGRLYTFVAAQNVCPPGWSLPSKGDRDQLISDLGGSAVAGGKMKATGTAYWNSPNTGATNESGFTALPSGIYDSGLTERGEYANFWINYVYPDDSAGYFHTSYNNENVGKNTYTKDKMISVRCIKD